MLKSRCFGTSYILQQGEKYEKLVLNLEDRHTVMHDRYEASIVTMAESAKQCHAIQRESLELIGAYKKPI